MNVKDLCLGILSLGDASGYDIRRKLEETFAHFMDVSPSGVYPALKQLAADKLVTSVKIPQEDRPAKVVYSLTDAGKKSFVNALNVSDGRHKVQSELLTLMFFAEHVPAEHLVKILDARTAELEIYAGLTKQWMAHRSKTEGTPGQRFLADYALAVMAAETKFLRAHVPDLLAGIARPQSKDKKRRGARS